MLKNSTCQTERIDALTYRLVRKPKPLFRSVARAAVSQDNGRNDKVETTVIVTRRPQTVSKTASAISLISSSALLGNDRDLAQVAARVAGMTITNLGPGRDKILLRGISDSVLTGRTQSTVGLYLDDVPITYNAPNPDLLLVDIVRIEVLKGPQGNLYGQGALSGVVRMVTRRPDPAGFSAELGGGIGVTLDGRPSGRITGMVNLPLLNGQAALRAVAYQDESGGFIKDDVLTKQASNDTSRSGGRVAFGWQVSPSFAVTATLMGQDLNSANSQYVVGRRGPYRRTLSVAEPHNNHFGNAALTVTDTTDLGALKFSANQLHHTINTGYDAQPIGRFVSVPNSGVLYYDEVQAIDLSTAELSLVSPSDRRFRWLAGLFAAYSDESFTPHLIDIYTKTQLYDEHRGDQVRDLAAFVRLSYDITSRWSISAGLRTLATRHKTDSFIQNVRLIGYAPSGHIVGTIKSTHTPYEVMLRYQPSERLMLYASSSDGFRTGGFNTTTQASTVVEPVYAGDKLESGEVGLKYNSPDRTLSLDAAAFAIHWHDIQSDQLRATGLPVTINIGDGTNSGVEVEAGWRPIQFLRFEAAGQYNEPRLAMPNRSFAAALSISGMPYIAQTSGSLTTIWTQSFSRFALNHTFTLSYRGGSPLNYGSLQSVRMPAYTNLDLESSVDYRNYRFGVRATNVTGVKSNSFAYGNPFSMGTAGQITPLRPPSLWLTADARF